MSDRRPRDGGLFLCNEKEMDMAFEIVTQFDGMTLGGLCSLGAAFIFSSARICFALAKRGA